MRARPYYAVPQANNPPNNVEAYPMPARAISSYAAPLIVMSANYEATPVNVPALTSTNKPVVISSTESEIEPIISSNNNNSEEIDTSTNYSENNNADDYVNTEVSLLVPDAATTNWVLETSRGDDSHYEGTTNTPVYLPTLTSSI